MISVEILRFDPALDAEPAWRRFDVPEEDGNTVLGVLLYIREHLDSGLAFRFSCRDRACGLCAVEVDGRPAMACRTRAGDGMRVAPLRNLAVIRDLVIDRRPLMRLLRAHELHLQTSRAPGGCVRETPFAAGLRKCVECLACVSHLPRLRGRRLHRAVRPSEAGPAALGPRDERDRGAQARAAGIGRCAGCTKCYCIHGLPAAKGAGIPEAA
jgi:succinate dehydrogenase/fumarate reductase iron-sulfur protein